MIETKKSSTNLDESSNLIIDGNGNLRGEKKKVISLGVVVVNGNLQAKYCLFRNLQVSGNSKIESTNIIEKGLFYGNAEFLDCNLKDLILKCGKFTFKNSTIVGDIKIKKSWWWGGEIILDNSLVKGNVVFIGGKKAIVYRNGGKVEGKISVK